MTILTQVSFNDVLCTDLKLSVCSTTELKKNYQFEAAIYWLQLHAQNVDSVVGHPTPTRRESTESFHLFSCQQSDRYTVWATLTTAFDPHVECGSLTNIPNDREMQSAAKST
jgi:hypothetical protein